MSSSTMMIHGAKEVTLSEKKVLDYGTGKCYMHDVRVVCEDGSTFILSVFLEHFKDVPKEEVTA